VTGAEVRARELGLAIPDFQADGYDGGDFGAHDHRFECWLEVELEEGHA
jgi:hypothetical protein